MKLAREVIRHLSLPEVRSAMGDEVIYQTFINRSDDFAEFRAARAEGLPALLQRQLDRGDHPVDLRPSLMSAGRDDSEDPWPRCGGATRPI